MSNYFFAKLDVERENTDQILNWMKVDYGFSLVEDVRQKEVYWATDVDFLMTDKLGEQFDVELKVRTKIYDDIIIETLSNTERGTEGWITKSKAYFLAYVFCVENQIHPKSCILHLPKLRIWFFQNKHRFNKKYAPNPPNDPLYHTEFYPIPIKHIPRSVFYPKTEVIHT